MKPTFRVAGDLGEVFQEHQSVLVRLAAFILGDRSTGDAPTSRATATPSPRSPTWTPVTSTAPECSGTWYLLLAEIPGVTAQNVTDVAGQADVALRFPFTDGVTEILFNASTYKLVGYARNGTETVITKVAEVTGPGSLTPACTPDTPGCTAR
jgi:hypothetical protein